MDATTSNQTTTKNGVVEPLPRWMDLKLAYMYGIFILMDGPVPKKVSQKKFEASFTEDDWKIVKAYGLQGLRSAV